VVICKVYARHARPENRSELVVHINYIEKNTVPVEIPEMTQVLLQSVTLYTERLNMYNYLGVGPIPRPIVCSCL
jgi:hypothetical protein